MVASTSAGIAIVSTRLHLSVGLARAEVRKQRRKIGEKCIGLVAFRGAASAARGVSYALSKRGILVKVFGRRKKEEEKQVPNRIEEGKLKISDAFIDVELTRLTIRNGFLVTVRRESFDKRRVYY